MTRRNTIQGALVLDAVNALRCHATADEIYTMLVHEHPNISKATVYRNLQRLCEAGEIQRVEIPGDADRFDHLLHRHYHAKCVECGRVFDVEMAYLPNLDGLIQAKDGFEVTGHDIVFKGVCAECRKKHPA